MRICLTLLALLAPAFLFAQTADTDKGCAPLQVNFTPPAGATAFFWDFKDGGTSNLASPSNIFTNPGIYAVEFRNGAGGALVGTVTITVWAKPDIGITAVPESGCSPLAVQFADTTELAGDIQILNHFWVFGDGGSASGVANTANTYLNSGTYTVSLELTTNYPSCNVTQVFSDKIKVSSQPITAFTTDPNPPGSCVPPLSVTFNNATSGGTGNLTYSWDFGNGNTSTLANPPAQNYPNLGIFLVKLTATDAFGCSATATANIVVGKPLADFTVPDTICFGSLLQPVNTSSAGAYSWTFSPDASPAASIVFNPLVSFSTPGLKTITLKVTSVGGCDSTVSKQVFVDLPDASFTTSPVYSCTDPTVFTMNATSPVATEWLWIFSNGTVDSTKTATYHWVTPDASGGYTSLGLFLDTVWLVVTNPSGCQAVSFEIDSVWRPNARFMPDIQHGCAPLTVVFADSSISNEPIVQWTWLFDDGSAPLVQNNDQPVTHTFNAPGEYEVQLAIRNSAGCVDTSYSVLIEVGEPIFGDFTADLTELCPGDSVHFTNLTNDPRVDGWHFSSDDDRLWHCYQNQNPAWAYVTEAGLNDVSLTIDYNGCFQTVTKTDFIKVKGPIAKLHNKTDCGNTKEFDFMNKSTDAPIIKWYLGDGDSSVLNLFTHLYDASGTYTVVLVAENPATGCPVSYDTATVYATNLIADCAIPDTICGGTPYMLDGSASTDVNATCYKGYTWYFSFQRPIRTDEASIEFIFPESGPQTVCLEVEDINGCKDTICKGVTVFNRYPKFSISDDFICLPSTVNFTDQSTADAQIVSWQWDFGDGTSASSPNATHTYTTEPLNGQFFIVKLTIKDEHNCPASFSDTVFVYKPVSFIISQTQPPNICVGETISFFATNFTAGGSSLMWEWDFSNGNTATGQFVQQTYNQHGQFPVKLHYTEIATGCEGDAELAVNVQSYPEADFISNVDGQSIICYPQNMQFTNTSQSNYPVSASWDLGNGIMAAGNIVATVFPKGTYTVTMTATTSFGCADMTSRSFTVVGPEGAFTMDKNSICEGDAITFALKDTIDVSSFSWSFGDGTTLDNTNPVTHIYNFLPPSGFTIAKLILRGEDDACTFTVDMPVTFSLVNADFALQDSAACFGIPLAFLNNSTSADTYQWFFGDGGTSTAQNPSHTFVTEGDYLVTLIATDLPLGCEDTTSQLIEVSGLPNIAAFGDAICPGDTATIGLLQPQPGYTYSWAPFNLVLPPNNAPQVQVIPAQSTDFAVTVTDAQGCQGTAVAQVFVPGAYQGASNLDTIVAKNSQVTLPVTYDPRFTFEWQPYAVPGEPPVVAVGDTSLLFTLIVRDTLGCAQAEFTFRIRVIPENVFAPNAFSPNSDEVNDVFRLIAEGEQGLVTVKTLKIYNRWGQKVFEGSGTIPEVAWDGTHDGKPAPSDVYVWVAEVGYLTGKEEVLKGDIALLR